MNNDSINDLNNETNEEESFIEELMLTTVDNPYDPFTQFDEWYKCDCEKKYFTCSYLDRIAKTNSSMTKEEKENAIDQAIKEIVYYNPDLYKVVRHKVPIGDIEDDDDYLID